MSLLLIDDQGVVWDGGSRQVRKAFDSPYSGGEFTEYAVLNLGFVAINGYGNSCQIRVRPSLVTPAAAAALADWLADGRFARVVLSAFATEWTTELLGSATLASHRLQSLLAVGRKARPEDFLSREVQVAIAVRERTALAQILGDWRRLAEPSGQHQLMQLLQQTFGDRYVVVKKDATQGSVVFHELGEGLFSKYETWRACAVGAPVDEQPDRNYGRWIASTYTDAIDARLPKLQEVDAIVRWPHAGRTRLRYRRLLVPIHQPDASPMLLAASLMDNRIDLRVAAAG